MIWLLRIFIQSFIIRDSLVRNELKVRSELKPTSIDSTYTMHVLNLIKA